jgi:MerR family copper efflux transcriptional regulator
MATMRISQLAERSGVPATTLRFYESSGLLPADRSGAGYRLYGEDAVRRLAFIDAAKHLGLPLEEIAELLAVWQSGACAQVKADLRPRVANRLAEAEQRTAELAAFTSTLRGALAHLDALPDRDDPCGPQCAFLASAPTPVEVPAVADVQLFTDRHAAHAEAERWRTAPVACSLTGDGIRERAAHWHRVLDGATRTAIPDGLRLTLPADRAAAVAALAADEQQCCAFFDFRLHLDGPSVHLEVRAPEAGTELLNDLFASAV